MVALEYLKRINYMLEFEMVRSKYNEMMAHQIDAPLFTVVGSCGDSIYLETIVSRRKANELVDLLKPYVSIQELESIQSQMKIQKLAFPK